VVVPPDNLDAVGFSVPARVVGAPVRGVGAPVRAFGVPVRVVGDDGDESDNDDLLSARTPGRDDGIAVLLGPDDSDNTEWLLMV
jgi:hypothetical protein